MNQIIRQVALLVMLFLPSVTVAQVGSASADRTPADELGTCEGQISRVYDKVAASVVLVIGSGNGLIVSPDGYVLHYHLRARPGEHVDVLLSNGHMLSGTFRGWSAEFGVGVSKIDSKEPLPHIELGTTRDLKAGDPCVAMGYLPRANGTYDRGPSLTYGVITRIDNEAWMTTSCALNHHGFGSSVFDMDGRLIGMTTKISYPDPFVQTAVDIVKEHWDDLVAGKNLDWVRFPPIKPSVFHELGDEEELDRIGPRAWKDPRDKDVATAPGIAKSTIERAKAATVRIAFLHQIGRDGRANQGSGVIVSEEGLITCVAHYDHLPGDPVTVSLSDGRDVSGVALGTDWVADVSLLKITDPGPWPHVNIGQSAHLFPGDPVVVTGYPNKWKERNALVDVCEISKADKDRLLWTQEFLQSRFVGSGGLCGGGVFDSNSRLVGITLGGYAKRIEMVSRKWDRLVAAKQVSSLIDRETEKPSRRTPSALGELFSVVAKSASPIVVEVICDGKRRVLGTIVTSDGVIVSKASELDGSISCRFVDGESRPATIEHVSRKLDLAVLKVSATELSHAEFKLGEHVAPGKLVAAILPDSAPLVGVVSMETRSIPMEDIWKGKGLKDSSHGVEVGGLPSRPVAQLGTSVRLPLKRGDILIGIEGKRVQDMEDFTRVITQELRSLDYHPGDLIHVTVSRDGKSIALQFPLPPQLPETSGEQDFSPRRSGFNSVFDTDLQATREMCGAPVVDGEGRLVGIVIASRGMSSAHRGPTHVLPADVIRQFVNDCAGPAKLRRQSVQQNAVEAP